VHSRQAQDTMAMSIPKTQTPRYTPANQCRLSVTEGPLCCEPQSLQSADIRLTCSVLYLAREGERCSSIPVQDHATRTHVEVCVLAVIFPTYTLDAFFPFMVSAYSRSLVFYSYSISYMNSQFAFILTFLTFLPQSFTSLCNT
jgi:hypothetical protein